MQLHLQGLGFVECQTLSGKPPGFIAAEYVLDLEFFQEYDILEEVHEYIKIVDRNMWVLKDSIYCSRLYPYSSTVEVA